jgi:2-oxoglutarate ferredoxin oxidoreductase subunit beta
VDSYKNIIDTKKAIEKSFRYQIEGKGFSLVEILSPCPVDWKLSPIDSLTWIQTEMISVYPLGTFKDKFKEIK